MYSVVIVEDELIAAEYLKEILEQEGFDIVGIIDNGKEAKLKIPMIKPDIVLMDIMLKDHISGSEVAIELKKSLPNTPIVFLTAYSDDEMIEYAINSNCHGYLIKPYKEKEILFTLKLILSKIGQNAIQIGVNKNFVQLSKDIYFDINLKRLIKNDIEIELSKKAILLFELLCKTPNRTIDHNTICLCLWGESVSPTTLRTLIYRIKDKVGENFIHNVNRLGYMVKSI